MSPRSMYLKDVGVCAHWRSGLRRCLQTQPQTAGNWMFLLRNCFCVLIPVAATICIGCGGNPGLEGLVDVSGSVTYQGNPVEGATVSFNPTSGARAASGRTDANGRFDLTSLNPGDGAIPGNYKVSISKVEDTDPSHHVTAEQFAAMVAGGTAPPTGPTSPGQKKAGGLEYHVPEKYLDSEKSGLTAEVTADGKNDFTFDLK